MTDELREALERIRKWATDNWLDGQGVGIIPPLNDLATIESALAAKDAEIERLTDAVEAALALTDEEPSFAATVSTRSILAHALTADQEAERSGDK